MEGLCKKAKGLRKVEDHKSCRVHCLTDWDQAGHYSWGSAVLAFLYRQLCEACRWSSQSASLGGCVYLLQLWVWSRLPVARPVMLAPRDWFPVQNARLQPT
jgi:hypothetical protein